MLHLNFDSVLGPVASGDIGRSFELMLKGMVGIFVIMLLIFLVIVILGRIGKKKKPPQNEENVQNSSPDEENQNKNQ